MATIAPALEAFFTDHLETQRQARPPTPSTAYRGTFGCDLPSPVTPANHQRQVDILDWDVQISAFLQDM